MKLTLLCNAGLALETSDSMLLVDLPNREFAPFFTLPEPVWERILARIPPYDKVCGFWFTHNHPDHCNWDKVHVYQNRWPQVPVFLPDDFTQTGTVAMGSFRMEYQRMDHAPIPDAPPHVVTWLTAGGKSLYLAADAALDVNAHRAFLRGRRADAAVWNSMFLSRTDTRELLREVSSRNYIYHMPAEKPDITGLWRKVDLNFKRFADELDGVTVWDCYPSEVLL